MTAVSLLAGLYAQRDLERYFIRQRCSPQPAMRRVDKFMGTYSCWSYEDHQWNFRMIMRDPDDARSWWMGDPWLPNQQFEYGNLADTTAPTARQQKADEPELTAARWAEIGTTLELHVVTQTGVRPYDVGPESTETGAEVYRRLRDRRAAAQIYSYEGRSKLDDLRVACPVRTDVAPMLRCVVLAEAAILLSRTPHVQTYIGIDNAPPGVAAEAAAVLRTFDVPRRTHHMLLR